MSPPLPSSTHWAPAGLRNLSDCTSGPPSSSADEVRCTHATKVARTTTTPSSSSSPPVPPLLPPPVVGAASVRKAPIRPRCVEARLCRLLAGLPPAARRALLLRLFTQPQRLALERWLLGRRGRGGAGLLGGPSSPPPPPPGERGSEDSKKSESVPGRSRSGVYGVQRHAHSGGLGPARYRAKVSAGPFHLTTAYTGSLDRARRYAEVLLRIRERVRRATAAASATVAGAERDEEGEEEVSFRRAVFEELEALGPDAARDLRLRFSASVPAKFWVGRPLGTPCFAAADAGGRGLEAGLRAWRRLRDLRSLVYTGASNRHTSLLRRHDRRELLAVWTRRAGRCTKRVSARLRALEATRRGVIHRGEALEEEEEDGEIPSAAARATGLTCFACADDGHASTHAISGRLDTAPDPYASEAKVKSIGGPRGTKSIGGPRETKSIGGPQETNSIGGPRETKSIGGPRETKSIGGQRETKSIGGRHSMPNAPVPRALLLQLLVRRWSRTQS